MREALERVGLVFLGGGAGSVLRWLLQEGSVRLFGPALPWGTFTVNALGSAALGAVLTALPVPGHLRLVLATGVMGGFTTYSSFNAEVLRFVQQGQPLTGALYVAATVVVCLLAGALGQYLMKSWGAFP